MTQKPMYPTIIGDYTSALTAPFVAGGHTTINVANAQFLPDPSTDGNTCTIRSRDGTYLVTVKYTGKTNTTLTGVTVVQGTPALALTYTYDIGCEVSKPLAQDDVQSIQDNIRDLDSAKLGKLYTSAQDGFIAKVDPTDHVLKVMDVPSVSATWGYIDGDLDDQTDLSDALDEKQDTLVSGTNIKTINSQSILGSGDIEIAGVSDYTLLSNKPQINSVELSGNKSLSDLGAQPELVSGTSIKTINSQSVLGSGNIQIDGVTDYEQLNNLPKINSVELTGNKSLADIGAASASSLSAHTGNGDIHVTTSDKSIWSAKQNAITALAKLSADLVDDTNATNKFFHSHASTHNKNGTDEIAIDASQVTSGIFSADRIPALAYQRMVTVADESAKSALTSEDVSVGDTVYVQDGNKLYIVSSITGKGTPAEVINYVIYTAYVSWNSVTGKPASYPPSAHAGSHTNGTDDIQTANTSQKGLLSASDWNTFNAKQDAITSASKLSADLTADGTTNKVYTSAEQTKLSGIESGAQVNVKPDWDATAGTSAEILNKPSTEVWTFTLTGGTTVTKNVYVGGN